MRARARAGRSLANTRWEERYEKRHEFKISTLLFVSFPSLWDVVIIILWPIHIRLQLELIQLFFIEKIQTIGPVS